MMLVTFTTASHAQETFDYKANTGKLFYLKEILDAANQTLAQGQEYPASAIYKVKLELVEIVGGSEICHVTVQVRGQSGAQQVPCLSLLLAANVKLGEKFTADLKFEGKDGKRLFSVDVTNEAQVTQTEFRLPLTVKNSSNESLILEKGVTEFSFIFTTNATKANAQDQKIPFQNTVEGSTVVASNGSEQIVYMNTDNVQGLVQMFGFLQALIQTAKAKEINAVFANLIASYRFELKISESKTIKLSLVKKYGKYKAYLY